MESVNILEKCLQGCADIKCMDGVASYPEVTTISWCYSDESVLYGTSCGMVGSWLRTRKEGGISYNRLHINSSPQHIDSVWCDAGASDLSIITKAAQLFTFDRAASRMHLDFDFRKRLERDCGCTVIKAAPNPESGAVAIFCKSMTWTGPRFEAILCRRDEIISRYKLPSAPTSFAWSGRDGFIAIGYKNGSVEIRSSLLAPTNIVPPKLGGMITGVAWSSGSTFLGYCSPASNEVRVFSPRAYGAASGTPLNAVRPLAVAFSGKSDLLAAKCLDGAIEVWKRDTGWARKTALGTPASPRDAIYSPGRRHAPIAFGPFSDVLASYSQGEKLLLVRDLSSFAS